MRNYVVDMWREIELRVIFFEKNQTPPSFFRVSVEIDRHLVVFPSISLSLSLSCLNHIRQAYYTFSSVSSTNIRIHI